MHRREVWKIGEGASIVRQVLQSAIDGNSIPVSIDRSNVSRSGWISSALKMKAISEMGLSARERRYHDENTRRRRGP